MGIGRYKMPGPLPYDRCGDAAIPPSPLKRHVREMLGVCEEVDVVHEGGRGLGNDFGSCGCMSVPEATGT
jgi:hypothetical protein